MTVEGGGVGLDRLVCGYPDENHPAILGRSARLADGLVQQRQRGRCKGPHVFFPVG